MSAEPRPTRISAHLDLGPPGSRPTWISAHLELGLPGSRPTWISAHSATGLTKKAIAFLDLPSGRVAFPSIIPSPASFMSSPASSAARHVEPMIRSINVLQPDPTEHRSNIRRPAYVSLTKADNDRWKRVLQCSSTGDEIF
ncbi:hypothetical protein OUZ56_029480 [Daphnia magna]|uniref:Uncharacterized protein n=1 Tax=Daphnia magna TaxID=35525 RepID=A0ABR0B6Y1_9CRUS|nr:hypothetical protein OUZ56_029480 [Daphnia magna]